MIEDNPEVAYLKNDQIPGGTKGVLFNALSHQK